SSLRLDLSGLGDSATRTNLESGEDRAQLDVQDAFAALTASLGTNRFVLLGLCSGAYNAHNIALEDPRVVGNVFMDGLVFPTAGHRRRVAVHRLTSPRFWRNAALRRIRAAEIGKFDDSAPSAAEFFELDKPAEVVAEEITQMLDQGQQLLYLYTQGCEEFSSKCQFEEMFGIEPNAENLQVEYLQNFEHTFPLVYQRKFVVERIMEWFERFSCAQSLESC
ncbi:MAG TPA: alpha/beta hydrolase, partial [Planctomycetaceae bacterium]|nr:alpha/beta hydrolase [Planctomycetaceae bacterium]